jgi:hypothetical protein
MYSFLGYEINLLSQLWLLHRFLVRNSLWSETLNLLLQDL